MSSRLDWLLQSKPASQHLRCNLGRFFHVTAPSTITTAVATLSRPVKPLKPGRRDALSKSLEAAAISASDLKSFQPSVDGLIIYQVPLLHSYQSFINSFHIFSLPLGRCPPFCWFFPSWARDTGAPPVLGVEPITAAKSPSPHRNFILFLVPRRMEFFPSDSPPELALGYMIFIYMSLTKRL